MYPSGRPFGRALEHAARAIRTTARLFLTIAGPSLIAASAAAAQQARTQAPVAAEATAGCVGIACPARVDPIPDTSRSASDSDSTVRRREISRNVQSRRGTLIFAGALGALLAANRVVHLDSDPGGYRDSWNSRASFPDKMVHGLAAFAITSVGVDLKVKPVYAALGTCAAGAIFETTQGYVSPYDIAADYVGAAVAGAWRHWRASR